MNRRCVNCPNVFPEKINKKYCDVCRPMINRQKKYLINKKRPSTRMECDLFCTKCFTSLPVGSHADKMYCEKCLKIHTKYRMKKHGQNRVIKRKLNNFYKNIQFNLLQSPYLVEIKTLNGIILLENK